MRLSLLYDAALGRSCTWRVADDRTVQARVRVACAEECLVRVPLRRHTTRGAAMVDSSGTHFVRCLDGSVWLVASAVFCDALPRLELELSGAPEDVHAILRRVP